MLWHAAQSSAVLCSASFLLETDCAGLLSLPCLCCVKSFARYFVMGVFYIPARLSVPSRKIWSQTHADDMMSRAVTHLGVCSVCRAGHRAGTRPRQLESLSSAPLLLWVWIALFVLFLQIEIQPEAMSLILETLICF